VATRTISNNILLASGTTSTINALNPSVPLTISGVIEGSGNLVKGYANENSYNATMNDVQTINFGSAITGGTFTLTVNGATTSAITWSSTPGTLVAAIQSALNGLPSAISSYYQPVVNGTSLNAISITFQNVSGNASASAVPTVMLNGANLGYTGTAITAIAVQSATPTALTESTNAVTVTETANTFTVGQLVTISGVTPAAYNGTYVVTGTTATTFTYNDPTSGLAAATVFGTVTGSSTATFTGSNNFSVGQIVTITGATPAADNGSFVITSLPAANQFTYTDEHRRGRGHERLGHGRLRHLDRRLRQRDPHRAGNLHRYDDRQPGHFDAGRQRRLGQQQ
jgi:hypothetical protein